MYFLFFFLTHSITLILLSFKKEERTPLHWASVNGNEAVVKLLLEKSGDPNAKSKVCGFFVLFLFLFCFCSCSCFCCILLSFCCLFYVLSHSITPLYIQRSGVFSFLFSHTFNHSHPSFFQKGRSNTTSLGLIERT